MATQANQRVFADPLDCTDDGVNSPVQFLRKMSRERVKARRDHRSRYEWNLGTEEAARVKALVLPFRRWRLHVAPTYARSLEAGTSRS